MMKEDQGANEMFSSNRLRRGYDTYAAGVAYIAVKDNNGDKQIGTCFHIGDGVFITARHVVEGMRIIEIGTTVSQTRYYETPETEKSGMAAIEMPFIATKTTKFLGPFYHPKKGENDIAAIIVKDINAPILPLGDHLDDWLGIEHVLSEAIVMGYPPIPFAKEPTLVTSKCEINAIVDKYTGGHPHFILSAMARGGFSGAPAISADGIVLGVVVESLVADHKPVELGYLSVMSVEGIYMCLSHNKIVPVNIDDQWKGFWNTESVSFSASSSEHVTVGLYRGKSRFYLEVYSYRPDIIEEAITLVKSSSEISILNWSHDAMVKIEFPEQGIDEENAVALFSGILSMIDEKGVPRMIKVV